MKKFAKISKCGNYRYALKRIWDDSLPLVMFVCLNPSIADSKIDDPTLRSCISFAKRWGYGGVVMGNLFALRSTLPEELRKTHDPVGPNNNVWLRRLKAGSKIVIAAWGDKGIYNQRDREVCNLFPQLHYLKLSKQGNPCHPLYLSRDLKPKKLNISVRRAK